MALSMRAFAPGTELHNFVQKPALSKLEEIR